MSSLKINKEKDQLIIIKEQIEYYLSDDNLKKDSLLCKKISEDENKYLDLDFILNYDKFKKVNLTKEILKQCIKLSDKLEFDKTGNKVRRKGKIANEPFPAITKKKKKNFISKIYIYFKNLKYKKIYFLLIIVFIIIRIEVNIHNQFIRTDEKSINYIRRKYNYFINDLPDYENTHERNKTIFWCWLQGKENAPQLALANLNSIIKNLKDFKIIIIDESNIDKYVNIPSYIIKKYKQKKFSKTHFSDLLRLELLIKYGGTWVDASVLITSYDERFFNNDLFFFGEKEGGKNSAGCVGSSWFINSEKRGPIIRTTLDLLYEYWRKKNYLYNYFIFHLFFKMASEKYQKDYKNVLFVANDSPHELQYLLNDNFNEIKYRKILNKISVHKLNIHKSNFNNNSFYSHIIEEYFPKNKSIL